MTHPDESAATTRTAPVSEGEVLAEDALAWIGAPYRNGGNDASGFDCSGLVQHVFAARGIPLPRGVEAQFRAGRPVRAGRIAAGDLVFFATTGSGVSHVGIAVGADSFVHAPSSNGRVRADRLSAPYWAQRFVGARRVARDFAVTFR